MDNVCRGCKARSSQPPVRLGVWSGLGSHWDPRAEPLAWVQGAESPEAVAFLVIKSTSLDSWIYFFKSVYMRFWPLAPTPPYGIFSQLISRMTKIDLPGAEFSPRAENLEAWVSWSEDRVLTILHFIPALLNIQWCTWLMMLSSSLWFTLDKLSMLTILDIQWQWKMTKPVNVGVPRLNNISLVECIL